MVVKVGDTAGQLVGERQAEAGEDAAMPRTLRVRRLRAVVVVLQASWQARESSRVVTGCRVSFSAPNLELPEKRCGSSVAP